MTFTDVVHALENIFLAYFIGLHMAYLFLNFSAIFSVLRYMPMRSIVSLPAIETGLEPPISVLVPAYNEEQTIVSSVKALLQLQYPLFEILVINDGSKDNTLSELIGGFGLVEFPEARNSPLTTKPIKAFYRSSIYRNLCVIDKENGGKADSLNAGINASGYPLFCGVDADSVLQRDSLERIVQPFIQDAAVIACGGTIRIANGCTVKDGNLISADLPKNIFALFQVVEYLRAFLFGRLGWSPFNALLIISGAFGLFKKDAVIAAGGYRHNTIGEDMELIVRLHRIYRQSGEKYKITFVPDPVCWTEAPEDLTTLRNQRIRWQRGLGESLSANMSLLFNPRGGAVGWLAFPFFVIFEWLGPVIEATGYIFFIAGTFLGFIAWQHSWVFFIVSVGFGALVSIIAMLLEEMSFHIYGRPDQLLRLFGAAILENFGYRQLNSWWRIVGLYRWAFNTKGGWGEMKRKGNWTATVPKKLP